ncbi:uncharacterized protein LOC114187817 [Vigna unguiculata]|uniref:uncharacterized protein LOC114187817 n=1 Tax=Vigna unguiculata TaxID=3917 RepID=UPI001015FE2E|nr:uncharacterized protein LOC114187817 [Vigna unguiculata]
MATKGTGSAISFSGSPCITFEKLNGPSITPFGPLEKYSHLIYLFFSKFLIWLKTFSLFLLQCLFLSLSAASRAKGGGRRSSCGSFDFIVLHEIRRLEGGTNKDDVKPKFRTLEEIMVDYRKIRVVLSCFI